MFLYSLIIEPIEVLIDYIFTLFSCKFFHLGPFIALYAVSLFVNYFTLPLYNYADRIQEKEREVTKKLESGIKHIKSIFKGNEQFMMLQAFYKENNYHPLYVFRSSLSILIEIPFFIAAYHYLSNAQYLNTAVFWEFKNLGLPDSLFHITLFGKSLPVNVLPIAMTVINFISAAIYTKGYSKRDKIQTYVIGFIFLVLLYNAPAGLVMYWICNNLFSLVKNIAVKTRFSKQILIVSIGLNIILFGVLVRIFPETGILPPHPYIIIVLGSIVMVMAFFLNLIKKTKFVKRIDAYKLKLSKINKVSKKDSLYLLLTSGLGLALLSGFLLPSNVIATSPEEFSFIGNTPSPLSYIYHSIAVGFGLFLLWPFAISKIVSNKQAFRGGVLVSILLVLSVVDAFLLSSNYGNLDAAFFLDFPENLKSISALGVIIPIVVIVLMLIMFYFLFKYNKVKFLSFAFISLCLSELIIGIIKCDTIRSVYKEHASVSQDSIKKEETNILKPIYHLTKEGKNVVVLFFDRATSDFFPYALDWYPELKEQFNGFTYYPNTLSYQGSTIGGSPSMMGGYEYTMEAINERDGEALVNKHNEAILTAPVLFKNAGYGATVTDPPWLNYTYYGDLRPFSIKEAEGIYVEQLDQTYYGRPIKQFLKDHPEFTNKDMDKATYKETINFSILQMLPPLLRYGFDTYLRNPNMNVQMAKIKFLAPFSGIYYLRNLTDFNADKNQYMFIGNNVTHEPTFLDETLTFPVDKSETAKINLPTTHNFTIVSYQAFVTALLQVGKWLDYLRENGVYDNTRIVIVSDHGGSMDIPGLNNWDIDLNIRRLSPLLLYKDFNSNDDIKTNETFMTNADTIFLSKDGLEEVDNTNPFTGKTFTENKSNGINVYPPTFTVSTVALKSQNVHKFPMDYSKLWHFEGQDTRDSKNWSPYKVE